MNLKKEKKITVFLLSLSLTACVSTQEFNTYKNRVDSDLNSVGEKLSETNIKLNDTKKENKELLIEIARLKDILKGVNRLDIENIRNDITLNSTQIKTSLSKSEKAIKLGEKATAAVGQYLDKMSDLSKKQTLVHGKLQQCLLDPNCDSSKLKSSLNQIDATP